MAYKHAVRALNFAPEHLHSCPESSSTVLSLPGQRGTDLPLAPISSQLCSLGGYISISISIRVRSEHFPFPSRRSIPVADRPGAAHGVRPPISSVPRHHHEAHDHPTAAGFVPGLQEEWFEAVDLHAPVHAPEHRPFRRLCPVPVFSRVR